MKKTPFIIKQILSIIGGMSMILLVFGIFMTAIFIPDIKDFMNSEKINGTLVYSEEMCKPYVSVKIYDYDLHFDIDNAVDVKKMLNGANIPLRIYRQNGLSEINYVVKIKPNKYLKPITLGTISTSDFDDEKEKFGIQFTLKSLKNGDFRLKPEDLKDCFFFKYRMSFKEQADLLGLEYSNINTKQVVETINY